jgi:UDP-N-acetylmuramate--alanine ligase
MMVNSPKSYFFLGIGGIGMSALARYVLAQGHKVLGYDKVPSVITESLINSGAVITFDSVLSPELLSAMDPKDTLVIWTPAIKSDHPWKQYFDQEGFCMEKRAVFLARITAHTRCLAIAGTHGKTTTSSILAHILAAARSSVTAFLGGIAQNYQSNFVSQGNDFTVVEADEFDRSFLHLTPSVACITSMDPDHLDIYRTSASFQEAFIAFSDLVPPEHLFIAEGLALDGVRVGFTEQAAVRALAVRVHQGAYHFDVVTPQGNASSLTFGMPGRHNLSNALMAVGMAASVGVSLPQIRSGLATFKGIQRRFNVSRHRNDKVLIDDYAHHPTELNALFQGVKEFYSAASNMIVFQPHLYSRTQDFGQEFARSLSQFDQVYILPIYPARELPILGIDSEWLCGQIPGGKAQVIKVDEVYDLVRNSAVQVAIIAGAGDIGTIIPELKKYLEHEV